MTMVINTAFDISFQFTQRRNTFHKVLQDREGLFQFFNKTFDLPTAVDGMCYIKTFIRCKDTANYAPFQTPPNIEYYSKCDSLVQADNLVCFICFFLQMDHFI